MADVVEVIARLGDSIVSVAHGPTVTVGEFGDVYAPINTRTFTLDDEAMSLSAGLLTIDVRRVSAATDHIPRERADQRPAAYIALSLLVHLALWGTSMHAFPGEQNFGGQTRRVAMVPPRWHPPAIVNLESTDPTPGISMSLAEPRDGIGPISNQLGNDDADRDESHRRAEAIASARTAGILGSGSLLGTRPLDDMPGTGELAAGFDGGSGAIDVAERGEPEGTFGSERRLRGTCVGEMCGPIGAGRYATICGGPTPDSPCRGGSIGFGDGRGAARGHDAAVPTVLLCGSPDGTRSPCLLAVGDLDKAIIRRHIRRKLPAITGCYEKQLLADATLSGTVETEFVIDANGRVHDVIASGVNPDLAACIASVLESIQFPRAHNGGVTKVHYPFSVRLAGG